MHSSLSIAPFLGLALLFACQSNPAGQTAALELPPVPLHPALQGNFDVESYRVELAVQAVEQHLAGVARVRLAIRVDCDRIDLRLAHLKVAELTLAGNRTTGNSAVTFVQSEDELLIKLAEPARAGDVLEFTIRYAGTPGRGVQLGEQAAFSRSRVPGAHYWMPVALDPGDRALLDLKLTLPRGWRSVAGGLRLNSDQSPDGHRSEMWRQRLPKSALEFHWAAGPGSSATADSILIGPADRHASWAPYEAAAQACRADLDAIFPSGPAQIAAPLQLICLAGIAAGDAAGALPLAAVGDSALQRDLAPKAVVREAVVRAWTRDRFSPAAWGDVWLEDALVETLVQLVLDRGDPSGVDSTLRRMGLRRRELGAERRGLARPLAGSAFRSMDELLVGDYVDTAGAMRLSLLRGIVGRTAFVNGLQLYLASIRGGEARWQDLVDQMAEASAMQLAGFATHWIQGAGHPELELSWRWDSFGERILINVKQMQTLRAGTPEAFAFPLQVSWLDPNGVQVRSFDVKQRRELFEIESAEAPTWLRFDPAALLPARSKVTRSTEEWLVLGRAGEDELARIGALASLIPRTRADASQEMRAKVGELALERAQQDPSWEAREQAMHLLGVVGGPAARQVLEEAARTAVAAPVRVAALRALEGWGRVPELASLASEVFADAFSPRVQGAAVHLRLAAGDPEDQSWFDERWSAASEQPALQVAMVRAAGGSARRWALARTIQLIENQAAPDDLRLAALMASATGVEHSQYLRDAHWNLLDGQESESIAETAALILASSGSPAVLLELGRRYEQLPTPRAQRVVEAAMRKAAEDARRQVELRALDKAQRPNG